MIIKNIKLLGSMIWFEAQRFRAFPIEMVATILSRIIGTVMFIVFWLIIGKYSSSGNIHPREVISYYLIIIGLSPIFYAGFGVASQTIKLIKYGELNEMLIKPINPLFYPWAMTTGRNFVGIMFGLVQVLVGVVIAGGISTKVLPYILPVLFNTLLINAAFNIIIGTFGFYFIDAGGIKNAAAHLAIFSRGELMPIFLMPAGVATFLQFTPFPASHYHFAILLQGTRQPEWGFVLIGVFWSIALMYFALRFWKHGLKKYEAVGA